MDLASSYFPPLTGRPFAVLFDRKQPLIKLESECGVVEIKYWAPSLTVAQPTPDEIVAALAAPEPVTPAQLSAYAQDKANTLLSTAQLYSVGGSPAVTVLSDALPATQTDLQALYDWGAASQAATQPWTDNNGKVTFLTGAQFVTLRPLVKAYRIAVFGTLGTVLEGIAATPATITATAQIDAAAWPTP